MSDLRARLLSDIAARQGVMLRDLAAHVAIPTGHNHTPGLDEYRAVITARLKALGATVELIPGDPRPAWITPDTTDEDASVGPVPPTAVCRSPAIRAQASRDGAATSRGRDGAVSSPATSLSTPPRLLLSGHLDTVFAPSEPFNQLTLSADQKTATGPGIVDMKGGILIAVNALEVLAAHNILPAWTFILNSDEETGSFHSRAALEAEAKRHDLGIAFEPALPGGAMAIERKGSGQFFIEVQGRSAHAGRDFEKGVSAVYALARLLTKIEAMSDLSRGTTVNVGPIDGANATNIVPDRARAWGNVRFTDEAAARVIEKQLDALATPEGSMPRVIVRHCLNRPAKPKTPATEQLALTARAAAESLGQQLPFASTGGVCDGNILQAVGLPTIDSMGVRGGGLHTHQEWLEVPSLVERCQFLAILFARLSGVTI